PWVDAYLTEKVINFLRDNNFGYIKIDYNSQIPLGCDGYESVGEGLRAQMAGTRRFFRKIKQELPDMVIELCASGGHRMVPDFLQLASQASFSDAHECDYIPVVAANVLRVMPARQNQIWCVLHGPDSRERVLWQLVNSMLGRMCLSGDVYTLADWQWQLVDEAIDFYREAAPIIEHGTVTRIENTSSRTSGPTGYQIVEKVYNGNKLSVIHRFAQSPDVMPPDGTILRQFGSLTGDWTAAAYITVL
ncbi:MAG: alpha-galactosidase, partial [Treponemataceae bacterium]|nr:alpha-galactosidase [Treponemataceae bacterium]